jgi:hypothetical protein
VIWTTKTGATEHEFPRHGRTFEGKLLRHKTTKRCTDDVRTLDTDRLQEMRDIVSQ